MFFNGPINLLFSDPPRFVSFCIAFIIAVSFHEFSHAFIADRLGDKTPRYQGRLTVSPFAHLDPLGSVFALFMGFGWGRPVQFNPWSLKNPHRDTALISLAGPMSNFLLAMLFSLVYRLVPEPANKLFYSIVEFNIILGVFNLIPIAPLDGFKVVGGLLPKNLSYSWSSLERYGSILLLLLFLTPLGVFVSLLINPFIGVLKLLLLG